MRKRSCYCCNFFLIRIVTPYDLISSHKLAAKDADDRREGNYGEKEVQVTLRGGKEK
jgi:hypothetical protein